MTGGGEERAVFLALKRDAQEALPKIAERNAHVVDSAVAKASQNLAAHADNEARTAADFRAKMPAANPLPSPRTAATSKIAQALSGSTPRLSTDLAAPRFGNAALRDSPNFDDEIEKALEGIGLSRGEYDRLRLTPTNEMSSEQIRQVAEVRNKIRIGDGQIVTKVINKQLADGYLDNDRNLFGGMFDPSSFGNSIARGTDTADLTTPAKLREGLALDDKGHGWTPIPEGAPEAYQLRFRAPRGLGDRAVPSYGVVGDAKADATLLGRADSAATIASGHEARGSVMTEPFIGTGYTAGGVPEWLAPGGTEFSGRAELWMLAPDGRETMIGYFHDGIWSRVNG